MGAGFAGRFARQHPDLIAALPQTESEIFTAGRRTRFLIFALLFLDGVISAVLAALFLPSYLGAVPFPISAVISGLVNAALAWAARHWTASPRVAALPLWAWLATVLVITFGGPADDTIFGGRGLMGYGVLLLIVFGTVPPGWVLWKNRRRIEAAQASGDQAQQQGTQIPQVAGQVAAGAG